MERKTLNVFEDVKEAIVNLKNHLRLNNDSDTIKYLIAVYDHSDSLPKEAENLLLELRK